jgi:nitrate reductase gamma subunit
MIKPMDVLMLLLAYMMYIAFLVRIFTHVRIWLNAAAESATYTPAPRGSFNVCALTVLEVLFFRKLFANDKLLWSGSWLFHLSLFFVLLRHLRYFLEPVPNCFVIIQPYGIFAGYVLLIALVLILSVRLLSGEKRYVSCSNYFILSVLLLLSISGLLMRNFFRPDLLQAKAFILGILTFSPEAVPSGILFYFHFLMALLLLLYVPSHIFTAPLVIAEAARREEGLRMMMHEK